MKISLAPIPYYWTRDELLSFYETIARAPVDIVYLGETVCSKRRSLNMQEWLELADMLAHAGKEVVLSSLSLLEAESELNTLRRICANGKYRVEANDMSAVHLLAGKTPFVAGPTINIYNACTLAFLAGLGMRRWVMPVELSRDTLAELQQHRPAGVETELFAFGRLPLAISARCFTAHRFDVPKDDCKLRCLDHPIGIRLNTQEDAPFLTLNGVQLQSAQSYNLLPELEEIKQLGVDILRISPQLDDTDAIIRVFHACITGAQSIAEAQRELATLTTDPLCDGYWHGNRGIEYLQAQREMQNA
ncbi:MAG: U32 family peptidase [Pseudomonadota bacterium]